MAALTDAIDIKRKMYFEHEGVPYHCLDKEISTPTARGGQTLKRPISITTPTVPTSWTRPALKRCS